MELHLEKKSLYGRHLIYPRNKLADRVAHLIGQKTLSHKHIPLLLDIGFTVTWVAEDPNQSGVYVPLF